MRVCLRRAAFSPISHAAKEGPTQPMQDYEKIRHAVKTGDKIMELAASLGLDPARNTVKDLADMLLQNALAQSDGEIPPKA
ncbi:conserved hypothetical protein [Solidesulfovibrio fructosivorans JJ]]|uniref:Uncharacterized protein n=1 Tax=Solidesulfovibrio fructosivorans JJ] TaxID=596151 RepID=E1K1V4_SOLFR|nr:hypothetical protein [Solidesulfovibrio fructosivorans]EFL49410.1 conserved hypothetical protein [Solidesulfovibrio fructosivorans JJ]]